MSTPSDVIIVNAGPDDAATIWQLFHQHFELDNAVGLSPLNEAMVRSCIGSWTDPNKYFEVLLAKHVPSGDFVGSCMYERKFSFYAGKIIVMDQLFVTEPFRGHKVGLKLMKAVAAIARNEKAVLRWDTLATNSRGIQFYESIGGQNVSELILKKMENFKILGFELDHEAIEKLLVEGGTKSSTS